MKKLAFAIAAVFAVGAVHSATLQWGLAEDSLLYVDDSGALKMATDYTGDTAGWEYRLIYLGANDTLSINNGRVNGTAVDSFAYGVYDDNGDAYADPYTQQFSTTGTATDLDGNAVTIVAGGNFGIAFFDGTAYDYVYTTDGSTRGSAVTSTTSLGNLGATANPVFWDSTAGSNIAVVAVPEPGIACMALLGIGMMIKRRRA